MKYPFYLLVAMAALLGLSNTASAETLPPCYKTSTTWDVGSGCTLKIGGTAVTSTAAELNILDGVTATAAELNLAADISANFEDTTATNVLTSAECGKTIALNSATEFVTTLPAPTAGCKFTFVVKAAPSGAAYTVVTTSSANILIGHVVTADIDGAADGDSSTADDTITFADGVAVVGDRVDVVSDGTSWYYVGSAKTYNGITASQAS